MRMFDFHPARSLLVVAVVAAFSSTLMGCPDKANPDPATGKDAGTAAAAPPAPKAAGSAAAPAKSGGW
jgi:hypothetical protein